MQHDDSSIEDILESIKKVIARDNREMAMTQRKLRETQGVALRDTAQDEADPLVESESEEVLDLGSAPTAWIEDDEASEQVEEPEANNSLTSDNAAESMRQSFAALSMLTGQNGEEQGQSALETMVRETLRPMLAEWLDANLPAIVEKLVRDEIDRIAGKKR